jgi:hypothetical protein
MATVSANVKIEDPKKKRQMQISQMMPKTVSRRQQNKWKLMHKN